MSDRDELIRAQNQVIGILFEIVKRYGENASLDDEYFSLASAGRDTARMAEIQGLRRENARIISRLLARLDD